MIIILIFAGLVILFVGLMIFNYCLNGYIDDTFFILFMILAIVFAFPAIGFGITAIAVNAAPEIRLVKWEEEIKYLNNKKEMLESYKPVLNPEGEIIGFTSDIYLHYDNPKDYYADVDDYNLDVKNFVVNIKKGSYRRDNPWTSWFTSPAYKMIDQSILDSLSYSIGK